MSLWHLRGPPICAFTSLPRVFILSVILIRGHRRGDTVLPDLVAGIDPGAGVGAGTGTTAGTRAGMYRP